MDVHNTIGGSLQISTEVIAKIARLAALEVDGVSDVATGTSQNRLEPPVLIWRDSAGK